MKIIYVWKQNKMKNYGIFININITKKNLSEVNLNNILIYRNQK